jgi:cyclase
MLARRIIPCLDVKDGRVVKGVRFRDHEDMGDPTELAARYSADGADELVFYDITASAHDRTLDYEWVRRIAREIDIPFCVAGGIRSVEQALACLGSGADKVSINSPALENPDLITQIANTAGSQCVVLGVDSFEADGDYVVHQYTGDPEKSRAADRRTLEWVIEGQERGAGEVVLNCMNRDGVREGYDLVQLRKVRDRISIPLVASGGAGKMEHFIDVFEQADVSGALAASVFHKRTLTVSGLKADLIRAGQEIRP